MTHRLFDQEWYFKHVLKIQTKSNGLQPFQLRKIQKKYLEHIKNDFPDGVVRSICLKSRQAGWSTLLAAIFTHMMLTRRNFKGIMLADKAGRTDTVMGIYKTYIENLPERLTPMIGRNNDREVLFDNPNPARRRSHPGLKSGLVAETAQDKNAGRSGTRQFAHLTEFAFYPYASDVNEGIQNSIPLSPGTFIVKESTAWGRTGIGESFYNEWNAAVEGQSIYKPFFVSWFDVDDYVIEPPRDFVRTSYEIDMQKRHPQITDANLFWRRVKIMEYASGKNLVPPDELFCQDFPSSPEEAFLFSGRPIFDQNKLNVQIENLRKNPPAMPKIRYTQTYLAMYQQFIKVFEPPMKNELYSIGADVAEGLSSGDFSTLSVTKTNGVQVAVFKGHLDPDHFGRLAVELAKIYNNAILTPEINNMGLVMLNAIKAAGYLRVFMRTTYDEISNDIGEKMGWRTTAQSKQQMISTLVTAFRDDETRINDIETLREMSTIVREDDGDATLNGKDLTVAHALSLIGMAQIFQRSEVYNPNKKQSLQLESKDLFRSTLESKK